MKIYLNTFLQKYTVGLSLCLVVVLFIVISKYQIQTKTELDSLLSNLIQFSGIFSALIITLIISKVFQIRQEKVGLISKIENLSNKVTNVRRIGLKLVNTQEFWRASMKNYIDRNYRDLDKCVMNEIGQNKSHRYYYLKEKFNTELGQQGSANTEEFNSQFYGFELYFDLKSLVKGDENNLQLLWEENDKNIIYKQSQIEMFQFNHCGDFWYFLSNKNKGGIYRSNYNIENVRSEDKKSILLLAEKIDKRFKGRTFEYELLADVGALFTSHIIPILNRYLKIFESKLPTIVSLLTQLLFVILIVGLFFPILLSAAFYKSLLVEIFIANCCLSIFIGSIFYFSIKLMPILNDTINISDLVQYSDSKDD